MKLLYCKTKRDQDAYRRARDAARKLHQAANRLARARVRARVYGEFAELLAAEHEIGEAAEEYRRWAGGE